MPLQGLDVDLAVAERRDHGHREAGKIFTACGHSDSVAQWSVVSGSVIGGLTVVESVDRSKLITDH